MRENQLDISFGRVNRDAGMRRTEKNTNALNPGWVEECMKLFRVWLDHLKHGDFQMEDFRAYAMSVMEPPSHLRVFGVIAVKAVKAGWIVRVGMAKVDSSNCHRAISNVWRKLK
jgi:hypothetical protein